MKISVIIPVYNASATLKRCLDSLASQSFRNLEIIFVDDCSSDDSLPMLNAFASKAASSSLFHSTENPDEHIEVKVIQQAVNGGVANARNAGLDAATGDYVYFLDADDWLESDALSKMAEKASQGDLDIVGCEWNLAFENSERSMRQPDFGTPLEALKLMMYGRMRWNLWLFLVRRSLYDGLRFIPGQNMGEDMLMMHRLFMRASEVGLVKEHLYHYAQPNLSATFSEKLIAQVSKNVSMLEETLKESAYAEQLTALLPQLKLSIKLPLLVTADKGQYHRWMTWWPEANNHTMQNPFLPLRTRMLQWCASKRMWFAVKAYSLLLDKFYGLVYRRKHSR